MQMVYRWKIYVIKTYHWTTWSSMQGFVHNEVEYLEDYKLYSMWRLYVLPPVPDTWHNGCQLIKRQSNLVVIVSVSHSKANTCHGQ